MLQKSLITLIFTAILAGCSCSEERAKGPAILTEERLKAIREKDELILNNLDEEPQRMGSVDKETEGPITTETWTWKNDHDSPHSQIETLMYKDGELVSHTLVDQENGVTWSRQFRNGQVIQINEERKDTTETVFLENEKIIGRITSGKNQECLIYENGEFSKSEPLEVCEKRFNTAP